MTLLVLVTGCALFLSFIAIIAFKSRRVVHEEPMDWMEEEWRQK